MKIKLRKEEGGKWMFGLYRGNGGNSSLVRARHGLSLLMAIISMCNIKYLWRAITWR
jgi:hypothetical protein